MSTEPSDFQYGDWAEPPRILVYMGHKLPRAMTLPEVEEEDID